MYMIEVKKLIAKSTVGDTPKSSTLFVELSEKYFQQAWNAIKSSLFDVFRKEKRIYLTQSLLSLKQTNYFLIALKREGKISLVSKHTGRIIVWPEIETSFLT